jgi:hypothetical protein
VETNEETMTKPCDHKFLGSPRCAKCGWEPNAAALASKTTPLRVVEDAGGERHDQGHPHLIRGEFQSDKYPTTPRGKVPLSVTDVTAQDLLWEYAQRRRAVDAEFANDLELALIGAGYDPRVGKP